MLECTVSEEFGLKWVSARGRIDSMTSPEIQRRIDGLVLNGERILVADLQGVHYISSAGLRVFLAAQKQLKRAGGEIILHNAAPQVARVFEMGGLIGFFRLLSRQEIEAELGGCRDGGTTCSMEAEGVVMEVVQRRADMGELVIIGSQDPLPRSGYTERSVVGVRPQAVRFGTGLAALGDSYEDTRQLFGESIVVDHSLFFFPAVKRPAVDFMLFSEPASDMDYRFLHGFGFNGSLKWIVAFEGRSGFVELEALMNALFTVSDADLLGVVFLAESKGLWGMHLKRVPTVENAPEGGSAIFDPVHFPDWVNFPIEPADINHIVLAVGLAVRDREAQKPEVVALLPEGSRFHVHGGVFAREPLSRRMDRFEGELRRVASELEVFKVQHLLGQSAFARGIAGVIELKG